MAVLGIEGTAHTCGVGIVEADPGDPTRCLVLANRALMLRPESGGIHPREAADHHVEALPGLVAAALADAGLRPRDLDGIAFSQGPGLGPCLRTVATTARALALAHGLPLVGVNHCVAHLEVGLATTGATDPVMLYASGANTQIIAEARGRYRVFGETLDVGVGNALDKFAREQGMPFPGGPRVEELALEGARLLEASGAPLPPLPYSVKGMDVAFSGFVTQANQLVQAGVPLAVACHAFQEWGYAMLVEVTERALAHAGKTEVLLGGGVGRNRRLQQMLAQMAEGRGASFHCPEPGLLSDNGAMIAWNGVVALAAGRPTPIATSQVRQRYRTDEVELFWRTGGNGGRAAAAASGDGRIDGPSAAPPTLMAQGAEAELHRGTFLGRPVLLKRRLRKAYRDPRIERELVALRLGHEARLMTEARIAGLPVPAVLDLDPEAGTLVMEELAGPPLKDLVANTEEGALEPVFRRLGAVVARLHDAGIAHGDLTTSNVVVVDGAPWLIDFGLAERSDEREGHAVDLHVLEEALAAARRDPGPLWQAFLDGYRATPGPRAPTLQRLAEIEARGRHRAVLT